MVSRDVHQFGIGQWLRPGKGRSRATVSARSTLRPAGQAIRAATAPRGPPCADRQEKGSSAAWDRAKPSRPLAPNWRQRDDDAEADSDDDSEDDSDDDTETEDDDTETEDDDSDAGSATSAGAATSAAPGDDDGARYT
jgi:hypothetical protein